MFQVHYIYYVYILEKDTRVHPLTSSDTCIYIYLYTYVCVCMCVCVSELIRNDIISTGIPESFNVPVIVPQALR